jgi:hypothetical protein
MGVDRGWLFRELHRSLTLLAADGDTALAGLPGRCCKPDELALDFDNFWSAVVGNFAAELTPELVTALAAVNAALSGIRREEWTEEAVRSAPEWVLVRERARTALGLLDQVRW